MAGQIVYYDYAHCSEFIEQRARALRQNAQGIDALAIYRELFYSFSYEALEQSALTLGQFDSGIVYMFIPEHLTIREYPQGHEVARKKALELLGTSDPPLILELLSAQGMDPEVGERGKIAKWMRNEFLDEVLLPGKIAIQLYFDAGTFFREVLQPQLEQQGFELADDYVKSAQTGQLRLRHPSSPGKIYKLPWLLWVREMMGGGYSVVYLMACFATYLQKLHGAVGIAS
ncbi:MAG: hypothetical protein ACR2IE_06405 [Candidatus Sumerlaeaceae bacterium]